MRCIPLVRLLSKLGVSSRKQAVWNVLAGRVSVNGRVTLDPGLRVSERDKILLDAKPVSKKRKIYILLNKPAGYVTTRNDEKDRKTVYDLLKGVGDWVFPVGRLDKDSEGLLIFTNDTDFGNKLTDPKYNVTRTYEVWLEGEISPEDIGKIEKGMDIGRGEKTAQASIKIFKKTVGSTHLKITLTEGKNREIRRLFDAVGAPVKRLLRTHFGQFSLGDLPSGKWREITRACTSG